MILRRRALSLPITAASLILVAVAPAWPVTLTFDELPFQPVDGLSFMGVTFDFKVGGVDSVDANYGAGGPGSITFVQDPSLEGDAAGILMLNFAAPTPVLEFGVALSSESDLFPGFSVEVFDAALVSLGVTTVDTHPLVSFTEGQFSYSGGAPVRRALIDFNDAAAPRFALDNLTFTAAVPEPASLLLLGSGLAGLAAVVWRRHRRI